MLTTIIAARSKSERFLRSINWIWLATYINECEARNFPAAAPRNGAPEIGISIEKTEDVLLLVWSQLVHLSVGCKNLCDETEGV
jgi:hypothetical protein